MQVTSQPDEWQVVVQLEDDAEEASYVYDLVRSGRLLVEASERLPLPFRGQFLFRLPRLPQPITIQVARFEPTPTEVVAGNRGLKFHISCPRDSAEALAELESALREVPVAAHEELEAGASDHVDEFTRVRRMTYPQRVIYATRAGQTGRAVLIQQPSPLVLLYLCKNPLITIGEVIQIAKMPSIDALVADYLVKALRSNPQWGASEELKVALASNVKTPVGTALSLLTHLSSGNLRSLCKHGQLRGSLKQAAMKLLLARKQ